MTRSQDVPDPRSEGSGPDHDRLDNGLRAPAYVPLIDVADAIGRHLLTALARARIAAYLEPGPADADPNSAGRRLFVASEERVDARTIVAAAVRGMGEPEPALPQPADDPLAGVDTDALFDALVADWHVDTHLAIRDAERDLTREDADWRARLARPAVAEDPVWLDDDHYVPPPPPPLPRLSGPAILAIVLLVGSLTMLAFGASLGFAGNFVLVAGIGGILVSGGILLSRVREYHRDEDDDGSAI